MDYPCKSAIRDIGISTAKKSIAALIIIAHTVIRKINAAILISTGCIICFPQHVRPPRDNTLLFLAQIRCARGMMCDCRESGRVQRRIFGSLKPDAALTDQVAGHSLLLRSR